MPELKSESKRLDIPHLQSSSISQPESIGMMQNITPIKPPESSHANMSQKDQHENKASGKKETKSPGNNVTANQSNSFQSFNQPQLINLGNGYYLQTNQKMMLSNSNQHFYVP